MCWTCLKICSYRWLDGSPVVFEMWDKNQPHFLNDDEHCVAMSPFTGVQPRNLSVMFHGTKMTPRILDYLTELWHNSNCGFERNAICKRSSSAKYNYTATPTVHPSGGCPANWTKLVSKVRLHVQIWHVENWKKQIHLTIKGSP